MKGAYQDEKVAVYEPVKLAEDTTLYKAMQGVGE